MVSLVTNFDEVTSKSIAAFMKIYTASNTCKVSFIIKPLRMFAANEKVFKLFF